MISIIEQTLKYYSTNEMDAFKKSEYFSKIYLLAHNDGFYVNCSVGYAENNVRETYLGIEITNADGEIIVVDEKDYSHLCAATCIISIDKKDRISFLPWTDEDFIDSLEWIICELKNIDSINTSYMS